MKIILAKLNSMSWQLHHWNGQLANYAIAYSAEDSFIQKSRSFEGFQTDFYRIMNIIMLCMSVKQAYADVWKVYILYRFCITHALALAHNTQRM